MVAIKATNNRLSAAFDPNDSVGILDSHHPNAEFFTTFEIFDRFIAKQQRLKNGMEIDYISICSPNYLHDSHMRFALRSGAHAICEKPVVLNPWNIDALCALEAESDKKIHTILQLRLHPAVVLLKNRLQLCEQITKNEVELTYITARGNWYMQSWKGDVNKSGGIASNIGVHFFDMLHFLFGELQNNVVHFAEPTKAAGYLEYERARVRWFLSIDVADIPEPIKKLGQRTYRSIMVDGEEIEFSEGFSDLHTRSYEDILAGRGFSLEENRSAISTVAAIRNAKISPLVGDYHPFVRKLRP